MLTRAGLAGVLDAIERLPVAEEVPVWIAIDRRSGRVELRAEAAPGIRSRMELTRPPSGQAEADLWVETVAYRALLLRVLLAHPGLGRG